MLTKYDKKVESLTKATKLEVKNHNFIFNRSWAPPNPNSHPECHLFKQGSQKNIEKLNFRNF